MKKNIKNKLLTALRSGKYIHTRGELEEIAKFSDDRTNKCCALGVLMKVFGYEPWDHENMMHDPDDPDTPSQELPSQELLEEWGMDEEESNEIARYNDKAEDYNAVIKYIEENL